MKNVLFSLCCLPVILSGFLGDSSAAPSDILKAPPTPRIMTEGYYVREPSDRAWSLRFAGAVPLAGGYVVVHDAKGKLLYQGAVPGGEYSTEKPYTIPFAADGVTGDYRIVLIAHQNLFLSLTMPLTDLPFEVYGGKSFSLGHNNYAYFKPTQGTTQMTLAAYGTSLQVLDDKQQVMADTRTNRLPATQNAALGFHRLDVATGFAVNPGQTYILQPQAMYFRSRDILYLAFEPAKWFEPNAALSDVKWLEIVKL